MSEVLSKTTKIQKLPAFLIDQIKAGEVLESAASLVKEVIENSIDAQSDKVSISIEGNGLDFISIEDNGNGINYSDLPLAFSRHATSKIDKFDDLYSLSTFGFRGEALASIASISRVSCITTTKDKNTSKIVIDGGKILSHSKLGEREKNGTSIYVKDLFYNTPVRLKFIKSKVSEKNALKKILYAFFISYPEVQFTLKLDTKEKLILPKLSRHNFSQRIKDMVEKDSNKITIRQAQKIYDDHSVLVFVLSGHKKVQSFNYHFINGRYFIDPKIKHITKSIFDKFSHREKSGVVVFIDAPKSKVDINIHPNHNTKP